MNIEGPFTHPHPRLFPWLVLAIYLAGMTIGIGASMAGLNHDLEAINAPVARPLLQESSEPTPKAKAPASPKSEEPVAITEPVTGSQGYQAEVGAFSDVECGSAWCNKHEPKDNQIALNKRKWPDAKKVYIPAFDKTYRVVGNTYSDTGNHLDAEIWFGEDRPAALKFGIKTLLINVIN